MSYQGPDRRSSTTLTKEDLAEVIQTAMERHLESDQHRFVEGWMAKEQRKQELWEKIKATIIGGSCLGALGFIGTLFWNEILAILHLLPTQGK